MRSTRITLFIVALFNATLFSSCGNKTKVVEESVANIRKRFEESEVALESRKCADLNVISSKVIKCYDIEKCFKNLIPMKMLTINELFDGKASQGRYKK